MSAIWDTDIVNLVVLVHRELSLFGFCHPQTHEIHVSVRDQI